MEMLIKSIIPEAEMLLEMSPEELAGPLMECFRFTMSCIVKAGILLPSGW
jgi:hypothetical protein